MQTVEVRHVELIGGQERTVRVALLECDTVTQAKHKMLDIFYQNIGYSHRPAVHSTILGTLHFLINDDYYMYSGVVKSQKCILVH